MKNTNAFLAFLVHAIVAPYDGLRLGLGLGLGQAQGAHHMSIWVGHHPFFEEVIEVA